MANARWLLIPALLFLTLSCTKKSEDLSVKTLSFALTDDAKSLDPAVAYDTVGMDVIPLGVESLYQYKYQSEPLALEPLLAEEMPRFSADKKKVTIKLKKGVLWQDDASFPSGIGRELTAQDFLYAWKRIALPKLQSPGGWIFEKVAGWDDFRKKLRESSQPEMLLAEPVAGFAAPDAHTIEITLTEPFPQLPHVLTMVYTAPLPPEFFEKHGQLGLLSRYIGTGPYILEEYTRGQRFVLKKNPKFRGEKYVDDSGQAQMLPFVEKITFHIFKEDQARWLNFMKGDLDVSGIPKDNFASAVENGELKKEMAEKGVLFTKLEQASIHFILFNMKDQVLGKNANLRRAIAHAIDRDRFNQILRNGRGVKATSLIPRVVPGHTARKELPGDYDLEKSRHYLRAAGFPEGKGLKPLRLDLRGAGTTYRLTSEFIQQALAEVGIPVELVVNTFPKYLEKERLGHLQFTLALWDGDYPDPQNFLALLYGKNVAPGPNVANYANPKFDRLYEKIAAMPPAPERTALIREAEDLVFADMPWAPMFYPLAFSVGHGWLKNFHPNIQVINHMKYFDVDLEKRRALKAKKPAP